MSASCVCTVVLQAEYWDSFFRKRGAAAFEW